MDANIVKKLRDQTGLSFAQINKALADAEGNEAKAIEILKSQAGAVAAKKLGRDVSEGIVDAYIHSNGKVGAMVELLCETDFVARNDEFKNLAHDISMHIAAMKPANNDELLKQSFVKDPSLTIKELITQVVQKVGENIQIGQFQIFEI